MIILRWILCYIITLAGIAIFISSGLTPIGKIGLAAALLAVPVTIIIDAVAFFRWKRRLGG